QACPRVGGNRGADRGVLAARLQGAEPAGQRHQHLPRWPEGARRPRTCAAEIDRRSGALRPRDPAVNGGGRVRLRGQGALRTGAAAAIKGELMGFGGAAAHLFVREGAKVVLTDIRDELGERAAAGLRADGHDARYLHLDVTSEQNWTQVVDAVMAAHGRLDILFNNPGLAFPAKLP